MIQILAKETSDRINECTNDDESDLNTTTHWVAFISIIQYHYVHVLELDNTMISYQHDIQRTFIVSTNKESQNTYRNDKCIQSIYKKYKLPIIHTHIAADCPLRDI